MEYAVLLTITSIQRYENEEPETTQLVTPGLMRLEEGYMELSYEETELTGLQGTRTDFRVEGERVILRRSGGVDSKMTFVVGQEDLSLYDMGFGALMINLRTESIRCDLSEKGGTLTVSYSIVIEEEANGTITYEIRVQPMGSY
ncbi:MAG: DUF1934 domain-containing protein [Oscillospiraceae bacterium]|nr:DUF1934 domain-containing protein [Oscillospiraceae bacterium]